VLNFDHSTVKHAIQNTQNNCHQHFLTALECTKFVFGPGSAPDPTGELTVLPKPLAGLRGPLLLRERGGEGKREKIRGPPPNSNSCICPWF